MSPLPACARSTLPWLGGALLLAAVVAILVLQRARLARELSELPAAERRALYERTLETLGTACLHARGGEVADYCRQQADFLTRFPECDAPCRDLAARFAPRPSR